MSFDDAFKVTMGHEGGYANDPDDPGGETFRGISRVHNPEWEGWAVLEHIGLTAPELGKMVCDFYRHKYWDYWRGNDVDAIAPSIAAEVFDTGVNRGRRAAIAYLQDGLNVLNKSERLYKDVEVDGKVGPMTLDALRACVRTSGDALLYKVMNVLQGASYVEIMRRHPSQEKWARGWFSRVTLHKRRH